MDLDILVPLAGMATSLILFLPIIRAGVRIAERKIGSGGDSAREESIREELRTIHERLDRIEFDEGRVAELEERLDFAERMLASSRQQQIDPGSGN